MDKIDYSKLMGFIIDDNKLSSEDNLRTPLLGLYSLFKELKQLGYKKVFVLSCDNPFIKPEVLEFFMGISYGYDLCIPKWENGFVEPLFTIYPIKKAYKTAKYSLEKKKYKLTNIINQKWKIRYVSIEQEINIYDSELISFKNLNKPSDVEELERRKIKEKN